MLCVAEICRVARTGNAAPGIMGKKASAKPHKRAFAAEALRTQIRQEEKMEVERQSKPERDSALFHTSPFVFQKSKLSLSSDLGGLEKRFFSPVWPGE